MKKSKHSLTITILVDRPESWIIPYVNTLVRLLGKAGRGHNVELCHDHTKIREGDLAFFLGCGRVVPGETLQRNKHNLVVHASDLPRGQGFAPLAWQILEGKNEIPIVLFEAVADVDAGSIYLEEVMRFEGHELNDEIRETQGQYTIDLVLRFVDAYPTVSARAQEGEATWYARRTAKDSELDPTKTLAEQFDLLRTVDNEHYPAFFTHQGHTYVLSIRKTNDH